MEREGVMSFENSVIRKVTLKLVPALIVLYLVAYIDRAAVSFNESLKKKNGEKMFFL